MYALIFLLFLLFNNNLSPFFANPPTIQYTLDNELNRLTEEEKKLLLSH